MKHPPARTETLRFGKEEHAIHRAPEWNDYGFPTLESFQEWARNGGGVEAMKAVTTLTNPSR